MKITKFTHACVRIEWQDQVLVIDPGVWSEPGALLGADAVLVTHEHIDHIDVMRLVGCGVPVFVPEDAELAPAEVVDRLAITRVTSGQTFTAAGFEVTAVGRRHATIYGDQPDCANLGYIVADQLYHPGDSLHVPDKAAEVLCVPLQASWLKTSEMIDFVKAVMPAQSFGIHDGQVNERGLDSLNGWLGAEVDGYRYLRPRQSLIIDHL